VSWAIEYTDEFEAWWEMLADAEQESIAAVVGLLEDHGPQLGYPHSSSLTSSRHGHMRELRIQHQGRPLRVLCAFDPRRVANDRWYEEFVPVADRLYDAHLASLKREGLI
jgi:hypothetical protein